MKLTKYYDYSQILDGVGSGIKQNLSDIIKLLTGSFTSIYGNINVLNEEEILYLYEYVTNHTLSNIDDVEKLIQKSAIIGNSRIFILVDNAKLDTVVGYDIIAYTKSIVRDFDHRVSNNYARSIFINSDVLKDINSPAYNKFIIMILVSIVEDALNASIYINTGVEVESIGLQKRWINQLNIFKEKNITERLFLVKYIKNIILPIYNNINLSNDDKAIIKKMINIEATEDSEKVSDEFFDEMFAYIAKFNNKNDLEYEHNLSLLLIDDVE